MAHRRNTSEGGGRATPTRRTARRGATRASSPASEGLARSASGGSSPLFVRWLLLVYLPLGLLAIGVVLLLLGALSGPAVWLTILLAIYGVIPVRIILEGRRRGRPAPTPRGAVALPAPPAEARVVAREGRPPSRQPANALSRRQRLLFGLSVIAGLLFVGGVLLVFGMARLTSSVGLALVAIGGFLMILSVTVPAFRLFDLVVRAVARVVGRRASGQSQGRL